MRLGVEAALVDGRLLPGDVALDGCLVSAVGLEPGGTGIAAPGFVDLQVNGFAGVDFLEDDDLRPSRRGIAFCRFHVHRDAAHAVLGMHQQRVGRPSRRLAIDGFEPAPHRAAQRTRRQ